MTKQDKQPRYADSFGFSFVRVWKLGPLIIWKRTIDVGGTK